jgi:hypothetical protein
VAAQRFEQYDAWALRWLQRWIAEAPCVTIAQAADVAASVEELPAEPAMLATLCRCVRRDRNQHD